MALPREPLFGGKGRGTPAEYTAEPAPEQFVSNSVDASRVRPLLRRRVLARHEAAFVRERRTRGGTAKVFALCPNGTGRFIFARFGKNFI